ncbi:MBL fold metallo-hydrolase [Hyphomonas sp.]|uniref:MBL fold metallo-hydrolase n=1 Tax=Hyphomonas sp. TaxID=87 RepID=UPI00391C94CC
MITGLTFPDSAGVSVPEALVLKGGLWRVIRLAVRYARFSHPVEGPCLIDTGYSRRVTAGRRSFPLSIYSAILRPRLTPDALPDACPDARTILLTHLHADHVSALRDYPAARIIADATAADHFLGASAFARTRHGVFRELLPPDFRQRLTPLGALPATDAPFGLGPARDVFGDGSVLAIPLPGHMRGHTGFLFPQMDPPVFYAGDAAWLARAIREGRPPGPPARWILDNAQAEAETAARLNAFAAAGGRVVLCHDPEHAG